MFWEVFVPQHNESHYFKLRENAIEYVQSFLEEFFFSWEKNKELLKEFEESDYSSVKDVIYLTERSYED